jgi:uncharacterized OB-fold protein
MSAKKRVPVIEGLFDLDTGQLQGTRCADCQTVYFPREETLCRNPRCGGTKLEPARLSTRGRVWSYTNSCYAPPAPYVPTTDPFEPITIAAVELEAEKMVVMGQVEGASIDDLEAGTEMEITTAVLNEDDENQYIVWKWRKAS